jgi:hypothetical protein
MSTFLLPKKKDKGGEKDLIFLEDGMPLYIHAEMRTIIISARTLRFTAFL